MANSSAKKVSKTRRAFLIGTGVLGGALIIGTTLAWRRVAGAQSFKPPVKDGETAFNAWLKILPDGAIIVQVPRQEMGQGVFTMLAMLVAEELDADWSKVRVEQAQISAVYGNSTALGDSAPSPMQAAMIATARVLGVQMTGGSTSTRDGWEPMRMAAAGARSMLLAAAAAKWNVPVAELLIEKCVIKHAGSGKSASFGEFAQAAAGLSPPSQVTVRAQKDWKILGTSPARLDVVEKSLGKAQFGIDVRPEGLLYATVKHIPYVSGALQEVRWKNGTPPKDVLHQVRGDNWFAVISTSYWSAKKALEEAELIGGGPTGTVLSSEQLTASYWNILDGDKVVDRTISKPIRRTFGERGDANKAIAGADDEQRVYALYHVPFLAHATMEPLNCTVRIAGEGKDRKVDVWAGNQAPTVVQWLAAGNVGVASENVTVHTPYLGGGFGRRFDLEVIRQALECAKVANGKPVQLIWSREEDIQHDAYRPAVSALMTAALDDKGGVGAWKQSMVGPSVSKSVIGRMNPLFAGDFPPDKTNAEGAAELPYAFANFKCDHAQVDLPVPTGYWRSVGNSYNAFFVETFVDELAVALKNDPYLFRLELLKDQPRFAKVVGAAASAAQWSAPLPKGWGRGIALAESFKSIACMVVDVEVVGKDIKVRRVVTAVDCGMALHPDNVKAQISGGAIYGLTAALKGNITLKDGIVQQSNFNDYGLMSMAECPQFETVIINSGAALGGIGEVGVPPIAPALGNAIYAATGKRLRSLPFSLA